MTVNRRKSLSNAFREGLGKTKDGVHSWKTMKTNHITKNSETVRTALKYKKANGSMAKHHNNDAESTALYGGTVSAGCYCWVESNNESVVWEKGVIDRIESGKACIQTSDGFDWVDVDKLQLTNPCVEDDMSSLWHINEGSILHNLEERSLNDKPYTFMGPVLVAVNPILRKEKEKSKDPKKVKMSTPHPDAVAETAFQQMNFAIARNKAGDVPKDDDVSMKMNQSIVVGGESGAGKTETSKIILKHLVGRATNSGDDIDKRLLGTNPILEAFGNASTLRNPNSSRFGKFLRLHFKTSKKGDIKSTIKSASVETFLLERSRVTTHELGERNFHVFYQLLAGATKQMKKAMFLDTSENFNYLLSAEGNQMRILKHDEAGFKELTEAMEQIGLTSGSDDKINSCLSVIAAILHLGNVVYHSETRSEGDVAALLDTTRKPLTLVARLLGIDQESLNMILSKRAVVVQGETIYSFRKADEANFARDALAKALYSKLFEWLLYQMNKSLGVGDKNGDGMPTIGVLDIFGFEAFQRNDFEQLLINFTNESLQACFNRQVFESEADLYRREKLVLGDGDEMQQPPNNIECMDLLDGVLATIVSEGQMPNASDKRLAAKLHDTMHRSKCFLRVHPKDKDRIFEISHYAGTVVYTVGRFLEKNNDALPKEVHETISTSTSSFIKSVWKTGESENQNKRRQKRSIVSGFRQQIVNLTETLDATRCSFVRCIKPNADLVRISDDSWFDRAYISSQLTCLSIPQTAEVLKTGFPTRIPYASLTKSYRDILPKKAIAAWKGLGRENERTFVEALFWSFKIPRKTYKLGETKVFFRSGMLDSLDKVLQSAQKWSKDSDKEKDKISKRFVRYFTWRRWRVAFLMVMAGQAFAKSQKVGTGKRVAATKIQAMVRGRMQRNLFAIRKKNLQGGQKKILDKKGKKMAKDAKRIKKKASKKDKHITKLEREIALDKAKMKEERKKREKTRRASVFNKDFKNAGNRVNETAERLDPKESMKRQALNEKKIQLQRMIGDRDILNEKSKEKQKLANQVMAGLFSVHEVESGNFSRFDSAMRNKTFTINNVLREVSKAKEMERIHVHENEKKVLTGEAYKLTKKGNRWKKYYIVVDISQRTLRYYVSEKAFKKYPEKPKGMYEIAAATANQKPEAIIHDKKYGKENVLQIVSGDRTELFDEKTAKHYQMKYNKKDIVKDGDTTRRIIEHSREITLAFKSKELTANWQASAMRAMYGSFSNFLLGRTMDKDSEFQEMTPDQVEGLSLYVSERSRGKQSLEAIRSQLSTLRVMLMDRRITEDKHNKMVKKLLSNNEKKKEKVVEFPVALVCPKCDRIVTRKGQEGGVCPDCKASLSTTCYACKYPMPAPRQGTPGYFGDNTSFCSENCRKFYASHCI